MNNLSQKQLFYRSPKAFIKPKDSKLHSTGKSSAVFSLTKMEAHRLRRNNHSLAKKNQQLESQLQRLDAASSLVKIEFYEDHLDGFYLAINGQAQDRYKGLGKVSYQRILRDIHRDDRADVARRSREHLAQEPTAVFQIVCRLLDKTGSTSWIKVDKRPLIDANGKIVKYLIAVVDITDIKLSEEKIREQQIVASNNQEKLKTSLRLHDGIGQSLAAANYLLDALNREKSLSTKEKLDEVANLISSALKETRTIARGLEATTDKRKSLLEMLKEQAHQIRSVFDIPIQYSIESGASQKITARESTELYFIAQEAILNAIKHSDCDWICVRLWEEEARLNFVIMDNGKGFRAKTFPPKSPGLGSRIMKYRAETICWKLVMRSSTGNSTVSCHKNL